MAAQPKELQIIPGGLNLAAPGDAIPDGDCLDLGGFFPGSVGMLEQAGGWTAASSGSHAGAHFHTLCQTSNRLYFGGTMGALWRKTGTAAETTIDSGYDGYPLGIIAYQGYVWVMNKTRQSRDNGTTVSAWTPPPPGLPVVTNHPVPLTALSVYQCVPANQDGPSGNYQAINMLTSESLAGVEVGGIITIAGITAPAGATVMNGSWQVLSILPSSPNSTVTLTALVAPGSVPSAVNDPAVTWTYSSAGQPFGEHLYWITWQFQDLGESNPSSIGTPPVITPAKVTVNDAGTYNEIDIDAPGASLLPPPAGVIGWNIYRQSPDMPSAYRLNEFVLDITRTYVYDYGDSIHRHDSDYLINGLGAIMEGDHDPAPAASITANQVYNGRILVANSASNPNRVWYTPALQPAFFRGSGNPQAGDWVDIGTDRDDGVLFMAVKPGQVTVYRQKSIWRITGDFADPSGRIDPVVPDLGVVGPRAVTCTSLGDYFRAPEGVYKFNGDWAQKISAKLDPVFRLADRPENFPLEDPTQTVNCALGFHAGRLWVSYTILGQTYNSREFIMHVDTARWFSRTIGLGAFLDTGPGFLGAAIDSVRNLETGFVDGPNPTPVVFQSSYQNAGLPDREKTWSDLVITHNTGGQQLAITIRTNKFQKTSDSFRLDATLLSSVPTRSIFPLIYPSNYIGPDGTNALVGLPIRSFSLAVRIDGNGVPNTPDMSLETPIILHYYLEARTGQLFDSDETDHGMPAVVKAIDMVEFDIDNRLSADARLQIYSDVPGGAMVPRLPVGTGLVLPQTTTRQVVRIVLPNIIEGKLLRYVVALSYSDAPTANFNLYGIRARVTPIGVYCDGLITEFFDTRPIPIGV
jgi:hypothetical protein